MKTLGFLIILILLVLLISSLVFFVIKSSKFENIEEIPKVIHKILIQSDEKLPKFPLEPKELQDAHDSWSKMNPNYKIKYYSLSDCRKYLKENFEDPDFLQAFECLIPYAFKCDFFRYCLLYNEGGWYSDWKQKCLVENLLDKLNKEKQNNYVFFNDFGNNISDKYISNGFLGFTKNNLILKEIINGIINNVKYKKLYNNSLEITGPGFISKYLDNTQAIGKFKLINKLPFYIFKKNKIIQNKNHKTKLDQNWENGNNYNKLWEENNIYSDFKIKDVIPKIIHKTGPNKFNNLPQEVSDIFKETLKNNPDYELKYYDDDMCYSLIKDNFDSNVLWAYETLIPTAYKADLFRYCVLYLYGGIYSDLTQQFLQPLDNYINYDKDTLILTEDFSYSSYTYPGVQISFMCTIPKNEIYIKCIDNICKNCQNFYYGKTSLDITGPYLFKNTLNTFNINYIIKLKQINNYLIDYHDNKHVIKTKSKNHHNILYKNSNHYSNLWFFRKVFKKEESIKN